MTEQAKTDPEVLLAQARRKAQSYGRCPECASADIRAGVREKREGSGTLEPFVWCGDQGVVLPWI